MKIKDVSNNGAAVEAGLAPLVNDSKDYIEELRDYSIKVTLTSGLVCVLRDMTVKDLSVLADLRSEGYNEIEIIVRIVARLCTQWGDKPGVTPVELEQLRAKDSMRFSKAIERFL